MNIVRWALTAVILWSVSVLFAADAPARQTGKVLLVYDEIDKSSESYLKTFREELQKMGFTVDEAALKTMKDKDPTSYERIAIYARVMAFTRMSFVRDWILKVKSLKGKRVTLFVTANRWFNEKLMKELAALITNREGTVVDAVSMATKKATVTEKAEKIGAHLSNLK